MPRPPSHPIGPPRQFLPPSRVTQVSSTAGGAEELPSDEAALLLAENDEAPREDEDRPLLDGDDSAEPAGEADDAAELAGASLEASADDGGVDPDRDDDDDDVLTIELLVRSGAPASGSTAAGVTRQPEARVSHVATTRGSPRSGRTAGSGIRCSRGGRRHPFGASVRRWRSRLLGWCATTSTRPVCLTGLE